MREYDNETLTKVQKAELGILRDFVDLCEKNNLTYFGIAGFLGDAISGFFLIWCCFFLNLFKLLWTVIKTA